MVELATETTTASETVKRLSKTAKSIAKDDEPPKAINVPTSTTEITKPEEDVKKSTVAGKSLRVLLHDLGGMQAETVEASLDQLLSMELWEGNNSKKRLQEAISMGAPSAVLRAMRNFGKTSKSIAEKCLAMLLGLTAAENKECAQVISELDGSQVIIQAMKDYDKDIQVQAHGCGLLCNISTWSNRDVIRIVKLGAVDLVIKDMKAYPDLAEMQRRGCKCLANLAAANAAYKEQIRTKKGITAIAKVLEDYQSKSGPAIEARKAMALFV